MKFQKELVFPNLQELTFHSCIFCPYSMNPPIPKKGEEEEEKKNCLNLELHLFSDLLNHQTVTEENHGCHSIYRLNASVELLFPDLQNYRPTSPGFLAYTNTLSAGQRAT